MRTPQETLEAMKAEVAAGLKEAFPITSGTRSLELEAVHHEDDPGHDDWNGQKDAVMKGRTWGAGFSGTFVLKEGGKVVDRKKVRLGTLPTPTNRHTFVVDGREYQVSHQRRLRPGIYTKVNRLGQPMADFNLEKGRNFSVVLDPTENEFSLKVGNSHVPMLPVLQQLHGFKSIGLGGHFDKTYTPEESEKALRTLHAGLMGNQPVPEKLEDVKKGLNDYLANTRMDPAITKMTINEDHDRVTGDALLSAAHRVLKIHKGELAPTMKDQLAWQEVHGVEDFLGERLRKNKHLLAFAAKKKLDRASSLDEINLAAGVQPLVKQFFTQSSLSNNPIQVNPLEMKENAFKITSMGEGGISDTHAIPNEVRTIHPSTVGFIDPVRTPDNAKAGVDVRTSMNTRKVGKTIASKVVDAKTKQEVDKTPQELFDAYVAHDLEPDTPDGLCRAIHRGEHVTVPRDRIQFLVPTEKQWTVSTAIVPFLPNSHAHRVAMGAKMLGQALSLDEREVPLVDTRHSNAAAEGIVPTSPVDGTVTKHEAGVITIKDAAGKQHKVNYAHEFPLNGGSFLHTDVTVKVGDKVRKGQLLGDNNFTKGGQLALGKNLQVAFIPFKGMNYEDGIVATESGASKLTSNHLVTEEVEIDERSVHDKAKFLAHFPGEFEPSEVANLDEQGVVKQGSTVKEGDCVIAVLRKKVVNPEQLILGKAHKGLVEPFRNASIVWDKPYEGRVTAVAKTARGIKVTIQAKAPLQVGDKLAGRYGNKGVVTAIVPDHEAPKTKDGKVPDLMLNSAGLVSRMNNGQMYEVIAGKALQAMGVKNHKFDQFMHGSTHDMVKGLVQKAGIEESEEMVDGKTGLSIGKTLMGPMYMLKLFKQAETGFSARSGGQYDIDLRPAKGGEDGAKSVGTLDLAGLLAHGSREMLREAATYKAEYNPEVFLHMWQGKPLPPPKPTFAYQKFLSMVQGMGVNVKKDGHQMMLLPMTDKDVLAMSQGQVTKPASVSDKDDPRTGLPFRPEEGGIFDPAVTGGLVGNRWSHIALHEPVVNPLFKNPARVVLGLKKAEFDKLLAEEGGTGIKNRLAAIDPAARLSQLQAELSKTNAVARRDEIYKQMRYLGNLKKHNMRPDEAYVLSHIPVIPPAMRPIYPDADTGKIMNSDANKLYQNLLLVNQQLTEMKGLADPETVKQLRVGLHDAVAKVQGLDGNAEKAIKEGEKEPKGFLKIIAGTSSAKEGFFQSKLMSRRQDVAARGVVVPDPGLGLDEVALPEPMAWNIYRNHATGELVKSGLPLTRAAEEIENQTATAKKALQIVMANTPIVMTRAPSLHKFNLQAFKPVLTPGKSIRVNNLIHKGFNMDHDGDAVNIHVPLGHEAIKESFNLLPSNNLFNPLNRSPVNTPTNETTMGLWKVTNIKPGARPVKKFATKAEALAAFKKGEIRVDDPIEVGSL